MKLSKPISPEQAAQILASSRKPGEYEQIVREFLESGASLVGIEREVSDGERGSSAIYNGLRSAVKKLKEKNVAGATDVRVVMQDELIYLNNTAVSE